MKAIHKGDEPLSTEVVPALTQTEKLALGALGAEAKRITVINAQYTEMVAVITKELETSHPGYTLNPQTGQLIPIPVAAKPEVNEETTTVLEMPIKPQP